MEYLIQIWVFTIFVVHIVRLQHLTSLPIGLVVVKHVLGVIKGLLMVLKLIWFLNQVDVFELLSIQLVVLLAWERLIAGKTRTIVNDELL